MLILTRSVGQAVRIVPSADLDPATPVGELFVNGPITIIVAGTLPGGARLAFYGDNRLLIAEDERFYSGR